MDARNKCGHDENGGFDASLLGRGRQDQRCRRVQEIRRSGAGHPRQVRWQGFLARGGRFQIMEGSQAFQRFALIEFPTFEQGVACFTSDEYDKAAAFRRNGAGEVETVIVEGVEAGK